MDTFGGYFEANTFCCGSASGEKTESSVLSDAGTSSRRPSYSDEDVILATSRPKKRAGRKVFKETRHPVYRGIRRRNKNKWVCEVRKPNDKARLWLGTYPNPEMAARAHDVAVLALRGRSACLNFADSAWNLHIPATTDADEIRRAAAQAAEEFRTSQFAEDSIESVKSNEEVSDRCGGVDQELKDTPESVLYMDEEALLDMPGLLVNMAEGLLLSPPHSVDDDVNWGDMDDNNGVSLWSFSI